MTIKLLPGGYHGIRTRTIKTLNNPHTEKLERPLSGASLEALNWTQKTRWRVNRPVLQVALDMKRDGLAAPGLPGADGYPLPPRLPAEVFASLTKEEKAKHLRDIEELRTSNAIMVGTRAAVYRRIEVAKDMAQFPAIWFPHFLDFRGRLYPLPQDLHTQGDSMTKGLLDFSEGQRLGPRGQWWTWLACANAAGHDKLPLQQRVDWTENNLSTILTIAADPMAVLDLWAVDSIDSPWEFLALCFEVRDICRWVGLGNDVQDFEGHSAIRLDATCSGIQHLSAMMRDEVAARAVNVLPTGNREDIYGDVARVAAAQAALDAANGNPQAIAWLGKVGRSTVKRAVMTTPYGVTERGIIDQAINDGHVNHVPKGKPRYEAATYLKDLIVSGLDENIGRPRAAMRYFQEVAAFLAQDDLPLQWTTPAGFTVRQGYFELGTKVVRTLHGNMDLRPENPEAGLVRSKQKASAAPNVVHSYDAAHLCLTACAMKREGVRDLAFVHDSFGTHAGSTDVLAREVREEFIGMYEAPALERWRESVALHSGRDDIPPIPELGTLDVAKVRSSEFFFS